MSADRPSSRAGRLVRAAGLAGLAGFATAAAPGGPPPPEAPVAGRPAEIAPAGPAAATVWLQPGERLRAEPDAGARPLALVDAAVEVAVLERRPGWVRVRYGDRLGWVALGDAAAAPGDARLPRTAPSPWRLEMARAALGTAAEAGRLGPFRLYTDVTDRDLLRFLGRLAEALPAAYRARYGLDPGPEAGEVVVLFAAEAGYRDYDRETSATADLRAGGHASRGLVALFAGDKDRGDVAAVLVHELTHLLNRRTLAATPAPWLEEGMANDLAFCRLDRSGRPVLGSLGGRSVVVERPVWLAGGESRVDREIRLEGPLASLSLVRDRRRAGAGPALEVLTDLDWSEFLEPAGRPARYDDSAFLVRFLLEGGDELAAAFRGYLADLASGAAAGREPLAGRLGLGWPELERDFAAWLSRRAEVP